MKTLMAAGCALALAACSHSSAAVSPQQGLMAWHNKYPAAARDLCVMEKREPFAARRLLQWERDNPIAAQELLDWATRNPGTPLAYFLQEHPGSPGEALYRADPRGLSLLLGWAANHPDAAQELANDGSLLRWEAEHPSWQADHPAC
jgi:hypothetical protein